MPADTALLMGRMNVYMPFKQRFSWSFGVWGAAWLPPKAAFAQSKRHAETGLQPQFHAAAARARLGDHNLAVDPVLELLNVGDHPHQPVALAEAGEHVDGG